MNYKNISTILNNAILKNGIGENVTIAEDLSNIVELGKSITNLSADDLKSFNKELIAGVHNYVINRMYEKKNFRILKDSVRFGGAIQRLTASGRLSVQDSHLLNLVNGTSYLDGKYYGSNIDARVYVDTKAFKVVHSISEDDFTQKFTNAEDVALYIGMIEVNEENTITFALEELEKRILVKLAQDSYNNGRKVELLTEFNTKTGKTYTLSDIAEDRLLMSYFSDFCKEIIARIKSGMKQYNRKYNDGTVETFSRDEDINTILISEFANDIKYLGNPVTFNTPSTPNYEEIVAWQNNSDDMLPDYTYTTSITVPGATSSDNDVTITNIVGMIYDVESAGITVKRDKVTVEPVGAEGFNNFHHHLANNYFCDSRFGAVVLTLD